MFQRSLWAAALFGSTAWAADPVIDGRGFGPNRELVSQLPFEHVDPMTGNLLLTFTDLELPGNGGFDLRIQRTYNSKIYDYYDSLGGYVEGEDSWSGFGWNLHFGRVALPNSLAPGPVIEMPDGSRHQAYPHADGITGHYMTRDYWTYERLSSSAGRLRLPNGVVYEFTSDRGGVLYVTEITDPFGNKIVVGYPPLTAFVPPDAVRSVEQRLVGGEVRVVTFTYSELLPYPGAEPRVARSLTSMTYQPAGRPPRTWTYVQKLRQPHDGRTFLTEVTPPVGPSWKFEYRESPVPGPANPAPLALSALTTPQGGRIEYVYAPQLFRYGSSTVYSPALHRRTVAGPGLEAGTWQYSFDSPDWAQPITAVVTSPCNKTRYVTWAIGPLGNERPWAIGTQARREVRTHADEVLEVEEFFWDRSVPISELPESGSSPDTHVPLLRERRVTRGGRTYRTVSSFESAPYNRSRPNNFNDYGRPFEAFEEGESGALSRRTTRSFFYAATSDPSFGVYIVDKTASETVRVPAAGSEAYTTSFEYETAGSYRGFLKASTTRGIRTEFTADTFTGQPTGNVRSARDANDRTTFYRYSWGRTHQIQTPLYTINRLINPDGTLASETRRGFSSTFEYDALGRQTRASPPVGHPTITTYDNLQARTVTVTRGPLTMRTTLDGLGQAVATENNLADPVKTFVERDACGRRSFESYPFYGAAGLAQGARFRYDALGRLLERTEPNDVSGEDTIRYEYGPGARVAVIDENGNRTEQNWVGFGDPDDVRLASLRDAAGQTTQYTYNTLGSLTTVTPPSGPGRSFTYYGTESGGRPGLLKTETHPESGAISYTYDAVGNPITRQDARGPTTHVHDANNRLVDVIRPGGYRLRLAYDASDNRTLLENLYPDGAAVKSTFTYDGANRLQQRRDELKIRPPLVRTFTTAYSWDANDRLDTLTYPSSTATVPRKAKYTYDAAGRPLSVTNPGRETYANLFTYHPTGAISSFRTGSGQTQRFAYTRRNRVRTVEAPALRLDYTYERNGNVRVLEDSRPGHDQTFGYDHLDRLLTVDAASPDLQAAFAYDVRGNRTSATLAGQAAVFGYDTGHDRLLTVTRGGHTENLGYDDYGNLVSRQTGAHAPDAFSYTPDHMLETATVEGRETRYRYDGDGLRVAKDGAEGLQLFVHASSGQLLSELRECPTGIEPTRDHIQAGGKLIAFVRPSPPTISLITAAASVTEQPGASVSATVRLSTASGCPTTVPATVAYGTVDATAIAGQDFATTAGVVIFPPGTPNGTIQTVSVPLLNDTLVEPNETFSLRLSAPTGAVLGLAAATLTILDNDTPRALWTLSSASLYESAGAATLSVRVTTPEGNAIHGPVTVRYATANGTARSPADYGARTGILTFAAGAPSGTELAVVVPVIRDALVENSETFRALLAAPSGALLGAPSTATVTLLDVSPVLSFPGGAYDAPEAGPAASLPVSLQTPDGLPTQAPTTVRYATSNLSALAGLDYTTAAGTLTFATGTPSGSTAPVSINVREDPLSEDDETFRVTLSVPAGGRLGTQRTADVMIRDDDPLPSMSIADASLTEPDAGGRSMTFTVRLSAAAGRAVSASYSTSSMSAIAPSDFTARSGTVTFAAGITSRPVVIAVLGDRVDEENEAFLVDLLNPVKATLGRARAQGVILDNDGRPTLCQPIALVPYTIGASGSYCLAGHLSHGDPAGDAIAIQADFVRLDLRGFRLDGSAAGIETQARGVSAIDRSGIVVRNGRVSGFKTAVHLEAGAPYLHSGGHLLEGIEADGSTTAGLVVMGRNNTVRSSTVLATGGAADEAAGAVGIAISGPGARVEDNDVRGTTGIGDAVGRALLLERAPAAIVVGNRLDGEGAGTGVLIRASWDVLVLRNRLFSLAEGIVFEAETGSGAYRGNFTINVTNPYSGGSDAGGNQ